MPSLCMMYSGTTKLRKLTGVSWYAMPVMVAMYMGLLLASSTVGSSLGMYVNLGVTTNRVVATPSKVASCDCVVVFDHPSFEMTLKLVARGITLSAVFPSRANALLCFTEKCRIARLGQSTNEFDPMESRRLLEPASVGFKCDSNDTARMLVPRRASWPITVACAAIIASVTMRNVPE